MDMRLYHRGDAPDALIALCDKASHHPAENGNLCNPMAPMSRQARLQGLSMTMYSKGEGFITANRQAIIGQAGLQGRPATLCHLLHERLHLWRLIHVFLIFFLHRPVSCDWCCPRRRYRARIQSCKQTSYSTCHGISPALMRLLHC